jgi:hypothetical protein
MMTRAEADMMSDAFDASGSRCRASPTISRHPPMVPQINLSILDIADKCLKPKKTLKQTIKYLNSELTTILLLPRLGDPTESPQHHC